MSAPPPLGRLRRDQRGAVMVEFAIVFPVILTFFLCILELARYSIAELMAQRAAGIAVRACAVIKDQPLHCDENVEVTVSRPPNPDSGQSPNQDDVVLLAAREGAKPLDDSELVIDRAPCTTARNAEGYTYDDGGRLENARVAHSGPDRVDLRARYLCAIPIARHILCRNGALSVRASAQYAHQGARYDCWFANPAGIVPEPGAAPEGQWSFP